MQPHSPESPPSTQAAPPAATRNTWRGVLIGLLPLALGVGIVALTLALTAAVRQATVAQGFLWQQRVAMILLLAGLTLAALACAIATLRVWRRVLAWQGADNHAQAGGARWGLAITALALLLPLLLALLLPQHPTP